MTEQRRRATRIGIAAILALALIMLIILPCATALAEQLDENNVFDKVFLENIEELARGEYSGELEIEAEKEILYDINLDKLGYVYEFKVNGEEGYAIAISESGEITITEVFFRAESPYKEIPQEGKGIYHAISVYTYNKDGQYYWLTGKALSEEELAELEVFSFKANLGDFETSLEKVYYVSKSQDEYIIVELIPSLYNPSDLAGSCAPVAGANIIQFMDRKSPNLIPDYEPGFNYSNAYLFYGSSSTTEALIRQLYSSMGTDPKTGTTVAQFKSGMTRYCESMGYKLHYDKSIASNGVFNYEYAKVQLMSHRPLAIFTSKYSYSNITELENCDSISIYSSVSRHAMAAFGYREITYTLSGGNRIDRFLYVATGSVVYGTGYYNIDKNTTIEECYGLFVTDIN